jgi:hypothetical protein
VISAGCGDGAGSNSLPPTRLLRRRSSTENGVGKAGEASHGCWDSPSLAQDHDHCCTTGWRENNDKCREATTCAIDILSSPCPERAIAPERHVISALARTSQSQQSIATADLQRKELKSPQTHGASKSNSLAATRQDRLNHNTPRFKSIVPTSIAARNQNQVHQSMPAA